MQTIAVDIGGTQIRAALYPETGIEPLISKAVTTQGEGSAVERLFGLVESILPTDRAVSGIAIGVAGPLDPVSGVVYKAPNIDNWDMLPIKQLVQERFNIPTVIGNDANLAALGEWKYGAGVGHHHLVYLTISTGVGGGVIIDDRLLVGARGMAAEVGHITVLPDGPLCGCGHPGHLEAISSGTGIANYVIRQIAAGKESILNKPGVIPTARLAAEAAAQGDELCIEAFRIAGVFLGRAIADFLHLYDPTIVILGGSVVKAGELLMAPVRQTIRESVISPQYLENFTLATASLGDQVVLVGALALARG